MWCRHHTCYRPKKSIVKRGSFSLHPKQHIWRLVSTAVTFQATKGYNLLHIGGHTPVFPVFPKCTEHPQECRVQDVNPEIHYNAFALPELPNIVTYVRNGIILRQWIRNKSAAGEPKRIANVVHKSLGTISLRQQVTVCLAFEPPEDCAHFHNNLWCRIGSLDPQP